MTYIAIEIKAKGKTCVGCEFMHHQMRCPFYPDNDLGKIVENNKAGIGLDFFSKKPTRFPECIATTITVICDSCSNNESCGGLRATTNEEECIKADYSHWAPQTKGKI